MRIVKRLTQVERDMILFKYSSHPLISTHIGLVATAYKTYQAEIYPSDLYKVYGYPCLPEHSDPYSSLMEIYKYISDHPKFLTTSDKWDNSKRGFSGRLSGVIVEKYIHDIRKSIDPTSWMINEDIFLLDVEKRHRAEILDGQHRFMAYCLASGLSEDYFPVTVYLGINRALDKLEYME